MGAGVHAFLERVEIDVGEGHVPDGREVFPRGAVAVHRRTADARFVGGKPRLVYLFYRDAALGLGRGEKLGTVGEGFALGLVAAFCAAYRQRLAVFVELPRHGDLCCPGRAAFESSTRTVGALAALARVSLLNKNSKLLDYEIKNDSIILDFNNSIFLEQNGVLEEIVYSLVANYDVNEVIFKVEGKDFSKKSIKNVE